MNHPPTLSMDLRFLHWRAIYLSIATLVAGLAVGFALSGCRPPGRKPIPLTASPTRPPARQLVRSKKAVLVAIAPVISPKETLLAYSDLVDYLGEELHRPARVVQRSTYAETNELLREGLCDVAFVCSFPYVAGNKDFGLEALVVPQVRGKTTYASYIIVPEDSPARSLEDLRGKSFAFVDPMSHTGWLVPFHLLRQRGANPERFFSKTIHTHSHDNSMRAVADKLVDGAAVSSLAYQFMAQHGNGVKGIKVIAKSEPFGMPPVVVPPHLDPTLKAELRTVFLNMHRRGRGRVILEKLMIDKFVPPDLSSYQTIRRMMEAEERR